MIYLLNLVNKFKCVFLLNIRFNPVSTILLYDVKYISRQNIFVPEMLFYICIDSGVLHCFYFRYRVFDPRKKEAKEAVTQGAGMYHRRSVCCSYKEEGVFGPRGGEEY